MGRLVHTGLGSSSLVAYVLHSPPPHANIFVIGPAVINTHTGPQNINPEALLFKRAAFYNGLKSKVGLAAAKAAALRVNLNLPPAFTSA